MIGQETVGCILYQRQTMKFEQFSFGQIRIDGTDYSYDVVIDRGEIRKRKKNPSKKFRDSFGHTPLSLEEEIPWKCRRLVVGTGEGALPVMDEVKREATRRKVELLVLPTEEAMKCLNKRVEKTNAILHVTC
jgi:hypothetical protein